MSSPQKLRIKEYSKIAKGVFSGERLILIFDRIVVFAESVKCGYILLLVLIIIRFSAHYHSRVSRALFVSVNLHPSQLSI